MANVTPEVIRLRQVVEDLTVKLDAANDALTQYRQNNRLGGSDTSAQYFAKVKELQAIIDDLASQRAAAQRELFFAQQQTQQPVASSGDTVKEDQAAKTSVSDDNPNSTSPGEAQQVLAPDGRIKPAAPTTTGSNAVTEPTQDADANTNGPTVTYAQSQATSNEDAGGPVPQPPSPTDAEGRDPATDATANTQTGVGAAGEDSTTRNVTRTEIDALYGSAPITPKPNVLDGYASYTYSLSVYIMSADDYQKFIKNYKKNIAGLPLLFQSGGANINARDQKYFSLDYYIDNLKIKSNQPGKGTGSAHNAIDLSFTVIEPNGISLIDNLQRATLEYIFNDDKTVQKDEFAKQNYLLVIKFYGYDQNGNPITPQDQNNTRSDPRAIVEKYIPFQINTLKFKLGNRAIEYEWDCVATNPIIATGSSRGSIPYNLELSGTTLKDAFLGKTEYAPRAQYDDSGRLTAASDPRVINAPPKSDAAPKKSDTITSGIIAAMNAYQEEQVKKKFQSEPDVYNLYFASPALADAKITFNNGVDKTGAPMSKSNDPKQQLDPTTQRADFSSTAIRATAGMQLIAFLEQLARNSSYIQDQAKIVPNAATGKLESNGAPGNNIAWFNFQVQAVPRAWDKLRKDWAYDITYLITPYRVGTVDSEYFPEGIFKGVHKSYPYWFTGQNTAVISYEQEYNNLYVRTMTGPPDDETSTTDTRSLAKRIVRPNSSASSQGAPNNVNEPAANAAEKLYDPGDLANSQMTIIGDPAWIYQSDLTNVLNSESFTAQPFLDDGTINFAASQVFYEITFNTPVDYNLQTGLLDPTFKNVNRSSNQAGAPQISYTYQLTDIEHQFRGGKFTQELAGTLFNPTLQSKQDPEKIKPRENASQTNTAADQAAKSKTIAGTKDADTPVNDGNNATSNTGTADPQQSEGDQQGPTDIPDSAPWEP